MKLKLRLALLVVMLLNISAFAQEAYLLKGVVTSQSDNATLPGVTFRVLGTEKGGSTDFDGNFEVQVKKGDVLEFSYLGFATQQITIDNQKTLAIIMVEDATSLDEIVVVGYGTRKKSHLTGSIAKIGGADVAAIQTARVDDALAGKLSGVLIQNQSGEPGTAPKIQIRAATSISGDVGPLVVVDGYPISGDLSTVNPNDIESMEILKDAASAAIYGSRGAAGVILITTKKGKSGQPTFSFNTYTSISSKYRDNILMSGPEWAAHARSEIAAGNWNSTVTNIDPAFLEYRLSAYENSPGAISPEDWLFRNGSTQNYDFSMSGGSDNANYFASVGYQDTEGVVITQGFERVNARLNVDAKLGEKFKTGLSINGFASKQDIVAHDMRDLLRAYGVHPVYHTAESIAFVQALDAEAQGLGLSAFDNGYRGGVGPTSISELVPGDRVDDWHYGRANNGIGGSGDAGPAQKLDNADRWRRTYFANASSYLQYEVLEGLNVKTVLGGDFESTQDYYWQGLGADSRARTDQTDLDQIDLVRSSILSETTVNYTKQIGDHDISAVAGIEFQNNYFRGITLRGTNVPYGLPANFQSLNPADVLTTERRETRSRRSVFGRVNYAYADKYLFSASLRRDGDSRFGKNKRYETFPALSLGWNVHNEDFLQNNDVLSKLKLRFSTGSLGTTAFLGSYQSLSLLNDFTTLDGLAFLIPDDVENPDLTWQSNTETNYGIDLGFLNNRITLGIDYYTSDIENMLLNQAVTEITGTPSIVLNVGDATSSGLEFEFSAGVIQKEDFTWNVSANLSTVNTEITSLGAAGDLVQVYGQSGRGPQFRNYVGGELGEMWGLETIGDVEMTYIADGSRHPNSQTGESYVVDQNGDGEINEDDYVKIGQNTPDFYWGLNSSFNYKSFDVSMQFQGTHGADVYNIDPLYYGSQWGGRLDYASLDADGDRRADHNGEFYERNRNQTDAMIQDASYIALRNLTIGYTLDESLLNKAGINSVRIYGAATNLLYIMGDNYTSYNPEGVETTNSGYAGPTTYGVQVGASPLVRSFTLGLNVNF